MLQGSYAKLKLDMRQIYLEKTLIMDKGMNFQTDVKFDH